MFFLLAILSAVCGVSGQPNAGNLAGCVRPIDFVWVLDGSGSVGLANFNTMMLVVGNMSRQFPLQPDVGAQQGAIQFGIAGSARTEIRLDQFAYNNVALQAAIEAIVYMDSGGTATDQGIEFAVQQFNLYGRPPSMAVGEAMIIVTDGLPNDPAKASEAAAAARALGITIAAVGVGAGANIQSLLDMVGGDPSLVFYAADYAILANGNFSAEIIEVVCNEPTIINNVTVPIVSNVTCNGTVFIEYFANASSPVTLHATLTTGTLALCYSYSNKFPLPPFLLPGGQAQDVNTTCVTLNAGSTVVATSTAYPFPGITKSKTAGVATLYTSVSAYPSSDPTKCGGRFTLSGEYCWAAIAENATNWPGLDPARVPYGVSAIGPYYTFGDSTTQQMCQDCPPGMHLIGGSDPTLASICAYDCIAPGTFLIPPAPGSSLAPTCGVCDASCGTCVYPGGPRSCTSCPVGTSSGTALFPNFADPDYASPMWLALAAGVGQSLVPPPQGGIPTALWTGAPTRMLPPLPSSPLTYGLPFQPGGLQWNSTTGRCVASCPLYNSTGGSGSGGGGSAGIPPSTTCVPGLSSPDPAGNSAGSPSDYLAPSNVSLLLPLCVPNAVFLNASDGGAGSDGMCAPFAKSATNARLAASLAELLGVPPAAIFLRSCINLASAQRISFTYAQDGTSGGSSSPGIPPISPYAGNVTYVFPNALDMELGCGMGGGGNGSSNGSGGGGGGGGGSGPPPPSTTGLCTLIATYAYVPSLAAPGDAPPSKGPFVSAAALSNITYDAATVSARLSSALGLLWGTYGVPIQTAPAITNSTRGGGATPSQPPYLSFAPPPSDAAAGPFAPLPITSNCSAVAGQQPRAASLGGVLPLSLLFLACVDATDAPLSPLHFHMDVNTSSNGTSIDALHRDPITACPGFIAQVGPNPNPPPPAPNSNTNGAAVAPTLSPGGLAGLLIFLLILAAILALYALWRWRKAKEVSRILDGAKAAAAAAKPPQTGVSVLPTEEKAAATKTLFATGNPLQNTSLKRLNSRKAFAPTGRTEDAAITSSSSSSSSSSSIPENSSSSVAEEAGAPAAGAGADAAVQVAPPPPTTVEAPLEISNVSKLGEVVAPVGGYRGDPLDAGDAGQPYSAMERALEFLLPGSVSLAPASVLSPTSSPSSSWGAGAPPNKSAAAESGSRWSALAGFSFKKHHGATIDHTVEEEAVVLKHVDTVKGDEGYRDIRRDIGTPAYTAVTGRSMRQLPSGLASSMKQAAGGGDGSSTIVVPNATASINGGSAPK